MRHTHRHVATLRTGRNLDVIFSLVLVALAFHASSRASGQSPSDARSISPPAPQGPPPDVERRLDALEIRLNSELAASEKALTSMRDTMSREFNFMFALGAIGSLIGGIAVVWSISRDRRSHKDYTAERSFFEARTARRDEQAEQIVEQQIKLGGNLLSRSDDMLTGQLESMSKLGAVIGLVEQTFQMQKKREEGLSQIQDALKTMQDALAGMTKHFEKQYTEVSHAILPFSSKTRVLWTTLEESEAVTAQRARMVFETIPDQVRDRERAANPNKFAQVAQLLGTSAFYSNDVDSAHTYFTLAQRTFEATPSDPQYRNPRAFTYFYLALIEKTWQRKGVDFDLSLKQSKAYLEEAAKILEGKEGEVLTPVTLAEVTSYIAGERSSTARVLKHTLEYLEDAKGRSALDSNQSKLLGRAYLILGNVEWLDERQAKARSLFQKAVTQNESDPYAQLSLAASIKEDSESRDSAYRRGLDLLVAAKVLEKREVTARGLALAWKVIALNELQRREECRQALAEFRALSGRTKSVGSRAAMFFSPISKVPVAFEVLLKELEHQIAA